MKLEKVGIQIGILCEKAGITRNKLCDGLCSESELALIEKGERHSINLWLYRSFILIVREIADSR